MKKILSMFIIGVLSLNLIGCSNPKTQEDNADTTIKEGVGLQNSSDEQQNSVEEEPKEDNAKENTTLTGVEIVSMEVTAPIGDRTQDNVGQENGEYMDVGNGIEKCSDYDMVSIVVELKNNRDELFTVNAHSWAAKMEDGYDLDIIQDYQIVGLMYSGDLKKQIQSNSTVELQFDILKEKTVKGDTIKLTFWDVDMGDKFTSFMSAAMSDKTEDEIKKEFPQYFDESLHYEFEVPLN